MGNSIGAMKKKVKIMKTDGDIFKITAPASDVLKDYLAGHVLLYSEEVKKYGIRAQQLRPEEGLKPGKIYFLVDMPKFPETRRAKSLPRKSIARERLEGLRQKSAVNMDSGSVRVKMRLPRGEIEKLMRENTDEVEGQRILEFCLKNSINGLGPFG